MFFDFDQIDLLQAQSTHTPTFVEKIFLDKPVIKDLSMFKHFCIYLIAHNNNNYVCILAFCCDVISLVCTQYKYTLKCLNMDESLMTGLSKKIFSTKVGVCVYFELANDQFSQSQATSTKLVKYHQKQIV